MLNIIKYRKMNNERYQLYYNLIFNIRKDLKSQINYIHDYTLNITFEEYQSYLSINNIILFCKNYFDYIKNNNINILNYVHHVLKNADLINDYSNNQKEKKRIFKFNYLFSFF